MNKNKEFFAETLEVLSDSDLSAVLRDADLSLDPSPLEIRGMVMAERIRRHSLECQDLDCGFSPIG